MKSLLTFTLIALVSLSTAVAQEKTETSQAPWFDMANCEVCQPMAANKDLMEQVKWETHLIPNGFLSVMVIPEPLKDSMNKAKTEMNAVHAKIENGETAKCCGFCQSLTGIVKAGAKKNELATIAGDITMFTSDDPVIIEKLHAHAKRTIAEHKKMLKEMHEDHSHGEGKKGE